jgi:hypothetical protein
MAMLAKQITHSKLDSYKRGIVDMFKSSCPMMCQMKMPQWIQVAASTCSILTVFHVLHFSDQGRSAARSAYSGFDSLPLARTW